MKRHMKLLVLLVTVALCVLVVLAGCKSELTSSAGSPTSSLPASPAMTSQSFCSDQFHLTTQMPQGWAVAEGPESLARSKVKRYVAINSWGQEGFWAREASIGNMEPFSPETTISQVPAGGAYVVLHENVSLVAPPGNERPEYTLNDLSGLIIPHDWRQDGPPQAQGVGFSKWGRLLVFFIACRADASDATVTGLNNLLQSWRFDEILAGDPGWAFSLAHSLLPAEVGPEKFPRKGGIAWDYAVPAVRNSQVEVRQDKTVHFRFSYSWNLPPDLTPGPISSPSETNHWWEIDVLPSGEAVLSAQGGTPLRDAN